MESKTCRKCKIDKGLNEFYKSKKYKCGYQAQCIECLRKYSRKYEAKNREERVEKHRHWRDENRDVINARNRDRWKEDEEFRTKFDKYKGRYKEWKSAYSRDYKKNNREKCNCREQLRYWIAKGVVQRPDNCQNCGKSVFRIEAHHEDYSKPLEVKWLCQKCHLQLHHKLRAA